MARASLRLINLPLAAVGITAVGLGAAALVLGNGEAVVTRGFKQALATMPTRTEGVRTAALTGIEQTWLTHVVHDLDAPILTKPVAVGDRITISSANKARTLRVVSVDQIDSSIMPVSTEHSVRLLLVTCRDEAAPKARPVRFLIEADEDAPTLAAPKAARAL